MQIIAKPKFPKKQSNQFDLNNIFRSSPSGIANKNFIDLIEILGVKNKNNKSKSPALNQRNKTALR